MRDGFSFQQMSADVYTCQRVLNGRCTPLDKNQLSPRIFSFGTKYNKMQVMLPPTPNIGNTTKKKRIKYEYIYLKLNQMNSSTIWPVFRYTRMSIHTYFYIIVTFIDNNNTYLHYLQHLQISLLLLFAGNKYRETQVHVFEK